MSKGKFLRRLHFPNELEGRWQVRLKSHLNRLLTDHGLIYKPTPKVKAVAASEGTSTPLKKKRGSTSKKAAQVSDMSAVKIEADYDPI